MKLSIELSKQIREEIIKRIEYSLIQKAQEYVRNEDMMHNFNSASKEAGILRERTMEYFRLKHLISRNDIINDLERENKLPTKELAFEKYGDIINYYILELESVLHRIEERENEEF
jgi:parvulin-like peptidyl-prolyl isomerase